MKPNNNIENRIYKQIINLLDKQINLNLIPAAKFPQELHLSLLVLAALDKTSAESIAKENPRLPSADTVLNAVGILNWEDVKRGFDKILETTLLQLRKQRWLFGSVTLAIDFHDDRYYGKRRDKWIIGTKPEKGTCYVFRTATIDIVMYGRRFTLATIPINKDTNKVELIEKLIKQAEEYVKIKEILFDGFFYDAEVITKLEELDIKYIIRADKSKKLRDRLERVINKERGYRVPWRVNKKAETTLVAAYDFNKKEWHTWVTNINSPPDEIRKIYKRRWGIETGYRVKGDFQANTCSNNFSIRLMYSLLAICLYNLWVLVNLLCDWDIIKETINSGKKYKPSITTRMMRKSYEKWLLLVCDGSNRMMQYTKV